MDESLIQEKMHFSENILLFVGGFPGGGTDLLKTILNSHPEIYLNGEMPLLGKIVDYGYGPHSTFTSLEEITSFQNVLSKLNLWSNIENINHDFSEEINKFDSLSKDELLKVCFSEHERRVWGNKTPQNTENIELLSKLFPFARFLIITRDVRDICLSWRDKWGKDMVWCASKWSNKMSVGWNSSQRIEDERVHFIRYEDLLLDTESVLLTICNFLSIPFSDKLLEHHRHTPELIDGKRNYGREIIRDNIAKWRNNLSEGIVERIEEIAFSAMETFNYEIVFAHKWKPITNLEKWRGKINDAFALALVGNRAKDRNDISQRVRDFMFQLRKQALK